MSDKKIQLSRRKALAALGASGAAVGLGGLGTYAQFTDSEEVTQTFTAGGIDGEVWAGANYNGEQIQELDADSVSPQGEGIGLNVQLDDVKPGDYGCFMFGIEVQNNPAWVAACLDYDGSTDGTVFEPEVDEDDDLSGFAPENYGEQGAGSGTDGEIPENMLVLPFYKAANTFWASDPCSFYDGDEETFDTTAIQDFGVPTEFWSETDKWDILPATLEDAVTYQMVDTLTWNDDNPEVYEPENVSGVDSGCVFLNGEVTGDAGGTNNDGDNTQEASALKSGDTLYFGWNWHVPFDTGNEMQGDTVDVKMGFNFSQTRHTQSAQLSNVFAPENAGN